VEKSNTQGVKKTYSPPEMIVYGTVEDLTRANANMSSNGDGGFGSNKKTV
jgi:hypothetical protein